MNKFKFGPVPALLMALALAGCGSFGLPSFGSSTATSDPPPPEPALAPEQKQDATTRDVSGAPGTLPTRPAPDSN